MKKPLLLTILALPGLLASCAHLDFNRPATTTKLNSAVLKAESYEAQQSLADYYEKAAADMESRARDAQLFASQYEGKTYLYGDKGRDTMNHSQGLAEIYQRAAAENRRLADIHRQIAVQLPCKPLGMPGKGSLLPCRLSMEKSALESTAP